MGGIAASAKLELEGKVHKSRGKAQSSTSTLDDVEKVKELSALQLRVQSRRLQLVFVCQGGSSLFIDFLIQRVE